MVPGEQLSHDRHAVSLTASPIESLPTAIIGEEKLTIGAADV